VAESLREVDEPLETVLRPGPPGPPAPVARALARSLFPPESACPAPAWLRPDQAAPFRRCRAALERHGGALLADPVGSGKTWVALAVAWSLGERTVAIVPAALVPQWRATAARLEIALELVSHEALSRGQQPDNAATFALVDESHRFRSPAIRRYTGLARWLVGRRALLLSATPVVNRLDDLAHQLLLVLPDDALRARGLGSILGSLRAGVAHPALGEVVLSRPSPQDAPGSQSRDIEPPPEPETTALTAEIARLRLSRDRGVAALVRVVLWRALASSPAALAGALDRYLALLDQAGAAAASGRRVSRAAIRAWCGAEAGQYLMWEVLPDEDGPADLLPADRPRVARLRARARQLAATGDAKSQAVGSILADGRVSIVFTGSRDTLEFLRAQWPALRPAWITGSAAGIGHARLPRATVLEWFRREPAPLPPPLVPPRLLLATDVAAEGLDLQRAERVVHYDLPWTSVRLDQREGRARRLGSLTREVEVLHCPPSAELETRLACLDRLARKRDLAFVAGLGDHARWLYRWRADLAAWATGGPACIGVAAVSGPAAGWLVGVAFDTVAPGGGLRQESAELWWLDPEGGLDTAPARLVPLLRAAIEASRAAVDPGLPALWPLLCEQVRRRLREAAALSLGETVASPRQGVLRQLRRLAAQASQRRDRDALRRLDVLIERLGGGLTAGQQQLVCAAAESPTRMVETLAPLLAGPGRVRRQLIPRLTGIVRVTTFPPCPDSAPSCSTSTAPSLTPSA